MSAATTLRNEGMHTAEAAADPRVIASIDAAIERAIASGERWSANSIRAALPTTTSQGLIGARVRSYAGRRPRVMVRVGYVPSNLPSTHAHPVALWIGAAHHEAVAS